MGPVQLPHELVVDVLDTFFLGNPSHAARTDLASFVRVSRRWYAAATPLLYRNVYLDSRARSKILDTLDGNHSLAPLVRELTLSGGDLDPGEYQRLKAVLARCDGVKSLSYHCFDPAILEDLTWFVSTTWPDLRYLRADQSAHLFELLARLPALTTLIASYIEFPAPNSETLSPQGTRATTPIRGESRSSPLPSAGPVRPTFRLKRLDSGSSPLPAHFHLLTSSSAHTLHSLDLPLLSLTSQDLSPFASLTRLTLTLAERYLPLPPADATTAAPGTRDDARLVRRVRRVLHSAEAAKVPLRTLEIYEPSYAPTRAIAAAALREEDLLSAVPRSVERLELASVEALEARRPSNPPSFAASEFIEITRRQRARSGSNALKLPRHLLPERSSRSPSPGAPTYPPAPHSSFPVDDFGDDEPTSTASGKAPPRLANEWEFSGWGSMSWLDLDDEEVERARRAREEQMRRDGEGVLGAWLASGVAGVAVAGSPLYAFPALVGIAGVYSPISLFVATLLLSFWRPIMAELASAFPISGANYAYLLNTSASLPFALFAAALTLLDDVATSVVAAATAASYIAEQAKGTVGTTWMTIVLLVAIAAIGLVGVRGTATVTLVTLALHLLTLAVLMLAAVVHWSQHGNETLRSNWTVGQVGSAGGIAKAVFQGVCIAFLGVTGFETAPDYATSLRPAPHIYPAVLRALQLIAIAINAPLLLCTFAVLPLHEILDVPSVLAALGRTSAGHWLDVWVTVDAVLILAATVLAGLVSAIALIQRLTVDGSLPRALLKPLPLSGAPAFVVVLYTALCVVVYASSGASLSIVSSMFAIVFLSIMALYPLSLLLLMHNRPTLPRHAHRTPFLLTFFTLLLSLALVGGVISTDPASLGYFAAYVGALGGALLGAARWGRGMRVAWWIAEHGLRWGKGAEWCVRMMRRAKEGKEVVVFVKSDEINTLFRRILYVQHNETTARIKLVHFYGGATASAGGTTVLRETSRETAAGKRVTEPVSTGVAEGALGVGDGEKAGEGPGAGGMDEIPSELEANFRLLDEAFPSITVDLVFLRAPFAPAYVHALSQRLSVPVARMFMGCPSPRWAREHEFGVRELAGVWIISE